LYVYFGHARIINRFIARPDEFLIVVGQAGSLRRIVNPPAAYLEVPLRGGPALCYGLPPAGPQLLPTEREADSQSAAD
jgi:hypothetical protein